MDEESKWAARDERMERLRAEVAILKIVSDPAARAHELILLANDLSLWADEEANLL